MSLRTATVTLLVVTLFYASSLAAFGNHFAVLEVWIGATRTVVDTVLFFIHPAASRTSEQELGIYRHVLLVTIVLTAGWILVGRRWLADWAADVVLAYGEAHHGAYPSRAWLDEAHVLSTLGAFGTVYLLFFDPTLNSLASSYRIMAYVVPLLSVIAFFMICRAMVFHRLAEPPLGWR